MKDISDIQTGLSTVDLLRPQVRALEPYNPIMPFEVLAARLGRDPSEIIKLDANENMYGPSDKVRQALAELPFPNIYPDPENRLLRAGLSDYTGIPENNLFAGSGADELIDLITRLFVGPGDAIIDCPPTFGMYSFDASINGGRVISVPRHSDFSLDMDAIVAAVTDHSPKLIFLTSPNNPDGSLVSDAELCLLLDLPLVVVLDEAYTEFAPSGTSRLSWPLDCKNLIVLRSFSKWAGLAGLRVGYGVFPSELLIHLWSIKQPYNVSVAATAAALASLDDLEYLQQMVVQILKERKRLYKLLGETLYLHPYPSHANFLLCKVEGRSAQNLKEDLEREGILVRYFHKSDLQDYIRVSVGRPEHTDALLRAL